MFEKAIEDAAVNYLDKADLNKDGIPDKKQALAIAANFAKAADDTRTAVDWTKATAALALLQSGGLAVLGDSKAVEAAIATGNYAPILAELADPKVKNDVGKVIAGAYQLFTAIDQKKLPEAFADLDAAWKGMEAYAHPKK